MTAARRAAILIPALAVAAVCARLGVWQLDRLGQRRAWNAVVGERLQQPPVDVASLPADSASRHYRRVRVEGVPDLEHEVVLSPRTRMGAPGVHVVTPLRPPGNDTAILVNRGWIYSPDASTIDVARFREDSTTYSGYVELLAPDADVVIAGRPRTLRRLADSATRAAFPYPIAPYYIVATGDSARSTAGMLVMRLGDPKLDEGAHQSYAFQWFAFGSIAIVGAGIVLARGRQAAAGPAR